MKCINCNSEIQEDDSVCASCGSEITRQSDLKNAASVNRCPNCGAAQITLNVSSGKLQCHYCQHEFEPDLAKQNDISQLRGTVIGLGSQDIIADVNDVITFGCMSCGAEVVIDTKEAVHARCHWCRSMLSIKQQIPNGAVPDMVLPFKLTKDFAQKEIEKFVKERSFYAHPKFKKEFCTENIVGVYLPYMVVDINAHARLVGQGEHLVRAYSDGDDNRLYDADVYSVSREFDLLIDGLTVEASAEKLQHQSAEKTNNIINSIMPFDIENAVKWNGSYLQGYTSERRDVNIEELSKLVLNQTKEIFRYKTDETLQAYNRGMYWQKRELTLNGKQWYSAYLPIWLYSYQSVEDGKKVLHYAAVNARTGETMGSVPINYTRLFIISAIIEIICGYIGIKLSFMIMESGNDDPILFLFPLILLSIGFIYWGNYYRKYRNSEAKHNHESETRSVINNLRCLDVFAIRRKRLRSRFIDGYNNKNMDNIIAVESDDEELNMTKD